MNSMDEFTRNVMENDEVLAIDQDPLGKQAWRIAALNVDDTPVGTQAPAAAADATGGRGGRGRGGNPQNAADKQIWARPLWDGTVAVGFYNLGTEPTKVSISLKDLNDALKTNITHGAPVRDVWFLKDVAPAGDTLSADVARHGCVILKIGAPRPEAESIAALVKANQPQ
jgi:alpha-galactosidase